MTNESTSPRRARPRAERRGGGWGAGGSPTHPQGPTGDEQPRGAAEPVTPAGPDGVAVQGAPGATSRSGRPRAHASGSFYGWLWRRLPGRWPAKTAFLVAAAALAVVALFTVVFPWVEPKLSFNQVTVGR